MKTITLSNERRAALIAELQSLFSTQFDETLSDFRAGEVLDAMLKTLAPTVYNQAVEDVRAHFQGKLDDLSGEVYVQPEK
ncbi:DUF2164 family protein [Henriciella marina]|uniref:DUF2164 family protein n=1 Tax=Henriciella marina TaxID=453851 RepID=UPI00036088E4|nr:DUF2164 family protein [Henriciella marina]